MRHAKKQAQKRTAEACPTTHYHLYMAGPFVGVLIIRALLFGVYTRVPDFGNSHMVQRTLLAFLEPPRHPE